MDKREFLLGTVLFISGFMSHSLIWTNEPTADLVLAEDRALQEESSQMDRLRNEIRLLEKKLSHYPGSVNNSEPNPLIPDKIMSPEDKNSDDLLALRAYKADHESRKSWEWHGVPGNVDGINEFMKEGFSRESVDTTWSANQENELATLFSNNEKLQELSIVESQCKSTICRVAILTPDASNAVQVSNALSEELYTDPHNGDMGSYVTVADPKAGVTYVYIGRHSDSLDSLMQNSSKSK